MNIGEKILRLRKEKGLSQEDLAQQLNVSRQAISKWELGETTPDFEKIKLISSIFNVSYDYLMDDNYKEQEQLDNSKINIKKNTNYKIILLFSIIVCLVIGFGFGYYISNEQNKQTNLLIYDKSINLIADSSLQAWDLNSYGVIKINFIPTINLDNYDIYFFAIDCNKETYQNTEPVTYDNSMYTGTIKVKNDMYQLINDIDLYIKIKKGKTEIIKKLYTISDVRVDGYSFVTHWK